MTLPRFSQYTNARETEMDFAILFGLAFSFLMIGATLLASGSPGNYLDVASLVLVFGGTIGATVTQFPLRHIFSVWRISLTPLSGKLPTSGTIVEEMVRLSIRARREGILSLEQAMNASFSPFMKKGLRLAIDGIDPETVERVLVAEMTSMQDRHKNGIAVLEAMASYAPALGMMGTVIGLVQMLNTMEDPSQIGPAMALALITTFYGIILANLVFLPIAGKLRLRSQQELLLMEMMLEGIVAIANGENPRILRERLLTYQPPKERAGATAWKEPGS